MKPARLDMLIVPVCILTLVAPFTAVTVTLRLRPLATLELVARSQVVAAWSSISSRSSKSAFRLLTTLRRFSWWLPLQSRSNAVPTRRRSG